MKRFASAEIPADVDMSDPVAAGAFVDEFLSGKRVGNLPLVMNIPRDQIALKPLVLPPGTGRGEIAGMVHYQVRDQLPFPLEEGVLDFCVESGGGGDEEGVDVLAAAARKETVEYYRRLAEAADRRLVRLGLRPYANACCLESCVEETGKGTVALIHVNAADTEIDVIDRASLVYSRTATYQPFMNGRPTDLELQNRIGEVVSEVARSLQGYAAVHQGERIDRILVAGSTGFEDRIASALGARLNVDCDFFDPSEYIGLKGVENGSAYITVVGQAIGRRWGSGLPFDFLNPKRPARRADPVRRRNVLVGALVALVLIIVSAGGWFYLDHKQTRLDALRKKKKAERAKEKKIRPFIKRVEEIEKWEAQGVDWLDQFARINGLMPGPVDVYTGTMSTGKDYVRFTIRTRQASVLDSIVEDLQKAGYDVRTDKVEPGDEDQFGYDCKATLMVYLRPGDDVSLKDVEIPPRPEDDDIGRSLAVERRGSKDKDK